MTVERVIYARGGGHGHTMRAITLAKKLQSATNECTTLIICDPSSLRYCQGIPHKQIRFLDSFFGPEIPMDSAELIVDTFPLGIDNELTQVDFTNFSKRIFISRYNKLLNDNQLSVFDEIWDPYPANLSEWNLPLARSQPVGWLVRNTPYTFSEKTMALRIFDPNGRMPLELADKIGEIARHLGYNFQVENCIPLSSSFEKCLIIGAGYNTFYELLNLKQDIRFFPLARKYDDQFRRARMWNRSIESLEEFTQWLALRKVSHEQHA